MCIRLSNKHHCLTCISVLSVVQLVWGSPIAALGLFIFFTTSLGALLSPFWAGFMIMVAGFTGVFVRPSRSAAVIFAHMLLNVLAVFACVFAVLATGTYGIASQLPEYQKFITSNETSLNGCIFSESSPLFDMSVKETLRPLEYAVPNCTDLSQSWPFLLSLLILNLIGMILNTVALITNICTPCIEDRYTNTVSWDIKD